jgi:hypothetical protein
MFFLRRGRALFSSSALEQRHSLHPLSRPPRRDWEFPGVPANHHQNPAPPLHIPKFAGILNRTIDSDASGSQPGTHFKVHVAVSCRKVKLRSGPQAQMSDPGWPRLSGLWRGGALDVIKISTHVLHSKTS